jgi:hypothetical protein
MFCNLHKPSFDVIIFCAYNIRRLYQRNAEIYLKLSKTHSKIFFPLNVNVLLQTKNVWSVERLLFDLLKKHKRKLLPPNNGVIAAKCEIHFPWFLFKEGLNILFGKMLKISQINTWKKSFRIQELKLCH